jgi:hypothetical protein
MIVEFLGFECELQKGLYDNGRTALQLVDKETQEPIVRATVNMIELSDEGFNTIVTNQKCKKENLLLIKDWSENEGILDALVKNNIVIPTGLKVPNGFIEADVAIYKELKC